VAQFSFARLVGADPVLDVEMASTGEVACFGEDVEEAFLLAELSVGGRIPKKGIFISLSGDENKVKFLENARLLTALNLPLYATENTSIFLQKNGVNAKKLYKIHEKKSPNILEFFQKGKVDMAINITDTNLKKDIDDDYYIRRFAVDQNIPLFTNLQKAELFTKAIVEKDLNKIEIKSWAEFTKS
jgi:carbamoyl-phosphate synthase large subunit